MRAIMMHSLSNCDFWKTKLKNSKMASSLGMAGEGAVFTFAAGEFGGEPLME